MTDNHWFRSLLPESGGQWIVLGKDLTPQFEVTTGRRRISVTEMDILKQQHKDTPDQIEQYKWTVFWDAPLAVPGRTHLAGPARTADESRVRLSAISLTAAS